VALVGSRRCSDYGKRVTERLGRGLVAAGYCIVSGLARGTDTSAHLAALAAGGRTLACLGCGIDVSYPPENYELAQRMVKSGAVISEYPMMAAPDAWNFPRRNRVISGLSLGTVVVEAPARSGALHTAEFALEQNREVFAVPGAIDNYRSAGTNRLIKIGAAKLVQEVEDILCELQSELQTQQDAQPRLDLGPEAAPVPELPEHETRLLALLSDDPQPVDDLILETELPAAAVSAALLMLELHGLARRLPGHSYVRVRISACPARAPAGAGSRSEEGAPSMRISRLTVQVFTYPSRTVRDSDGHTHPGPEHSARQALLTITTDEGAQGYCLGSAEALRKSLLDAFVKPVLLGQDPFDREKLWQGMARWQRGSGGMLTDRTLALVELALWDLAGRKLGVPVWKLLGGFRDRVPAYGSTMCGDELPGGLATPEDYARFAEWLRARGYQAIKLHTWMPPVSFAPSVRMDLKACAADESWRNKRFSEFRGVSLKIGESGADCGRLPGTPQRNGWELHREIADRGVGPSIDENQPGAFPELAVIGSIADIEFQTVDAGPGDGEAEFDRGRTAASGPTDRYDARCRQQAVWPTVGRRLRTGAVAAEVDSQLAVEIDLVPGDRIPLAGITLQHDPSAGIPHHDIGRDPVPCAILSHHNTVLVSAENPVPSPEDLIV
jgi:DNA protecting protein DprA